MLVSRRLGDQDGPTAAVRATSPGWRDPRLWIGVVIVAASVLVGARVLAAADDTISVWALEADAGAGDLITDDDLVTQRIRFADGADRDRYFTVGDELPADLRLLRGLGQGELLPRAAVGSSDDSDTVEISLEVSPGLVPTSVAPGSVVDVYLVAAPADGRGHRGPRADDAQSALSSVTVVDAPPLGDSFGPSGTRQLVLAVAAEDVPGFYALLGSLDAPVISVARVG